MTIKYKCTRRLYVPTTGGETLIKTGDIVEQILEIKDKSGESLFDEYVLKTIIHERAFVLSLENLNHHFTEYKEKAKTWFYMDKKNPPFHVEDSIGIAFPVDSVKEAISLTSYLEEHYPQGAKNLDLDRVMLQWKLSYLEERILQLEKAHDK